MVRVPIRTVNSDLDIIRTSRWTGLDFFPPIRLNKNLLFIYIFPPLIISVVNGGNDF